MADAAENMEEVRQNFAMLQIAQNPLILQRIFKNVSASGTTLRLVCAFWNEVVLSLPRPKLALRFSPWPRWWNFEPSNCSFATPFELFCRNMEPRLARCISENPCLSDRHPSHQNICTAETKLRHVTEQFSQRVEDWTITFAGEEVIPTLNQILIRFLPNLRRLKIWVKTTIFSDPLHQGNNDAVVPLLLRRNLTYVEIHDDLENSGFLEMTQLILNSAPSLTHLNYHGRKFPDLSRHAALKSITLDRMGSRTFPSFRGVHGLNRMLDQVKDRLEFLHIRGIAENKESQRNVNAARRNDFHLPRMTKLKEFRNNMVDFFHCGDQLQDICSARIPTLETLELFKCKGTLDDLVQDIKQEEGLFSGVKTLHLADVEDPESIIGLKTAFPNLEYLSIQQLHWDVEDTIIEVWPHLRACASLGLKYLELGVANHHRNLSKFLKGFSSCGELGPGLKNLEIRLVSRIYDDLQRVPFGPMQMKQFLLGMIGLQNVIISGIPLQEKTWEWVQPFISKNKFQSSLINGVSETSSNLGNTRLPPY